MARASHKDNAEKFHDYHLNFDTRTIYIGADSKSDEYSEITPFTAETAIKNLHILDSIVSDKPITILLNTPGGLVYQGMAIYDMIRSCSNPVVVKVIGHCMSMGAIILQAGDHRYITPNSYIMLHDGSDGYAGNARDFERWAEHSKDLRKTTYNILAERTGKDRKYWERKMVHDTIYSAERAVREGLADGICMPDGTIVLAKDIP